MMTATSTVASSLPPVRTSYHVPLSLMASISEETISLWLKLGALEKLEQAVLDGYGDQLCGKTSRIPQVNKFLRQVPLFQSKIKEIHRAVSQGRLRDVQHLIDRKKLAFCRDQSGATPLHKAVIFGHQDIIEYLVSRYGGVIHVRDHQGRSPLHYAAFLPDGGEIYQFLLAAGADERAMDVFGRQPSFYVDGQNESTLRQLREGTSMNGIRKIKARYYNQSPSNKPLENGTKLVVSKMQVRELIADGNLDPLEDLVLQGHGDRLLGEAAKDPRVQTFLNIVPMYMERIYDIHRAVMRDQLEHVVILLENRRLAMARDQLGATPLHKAVWFGHYKIAHYISHHFPETLNTLDLEGRTPLHYAAALRDNKHMYGILAEAGANKSIFDNKGKTADYYLQYPEHLDLDDVIKRCHKVNANYLANTANRIKGKSPTRQTPPPSNGSSSSPRSDDNNVSSKESGTSGENGTEPEQMLAMLQKDNLAKRVDICSANIQRWLQSKDMEKLERAVMEGYGEKVVRIQGDQDFDEQNDEDMDLSVKMSQMVQTVNAIHTAVYNDDVVELQSQLNQPDYVLAKDHMGMTPLHRAVLLGRTNILKYLIDKFPETVNVKNKEGRTALHYAAAMSRKDGQNLYKILFQGGADSKIRDNHGRTSDYYKTHLLTLPNKGQKTRTGNGIPTRHSEPLNRYSKQGVLERMTVALQRGDVELLQELVLEGHGRHLLGKTSWNDDVKQFLKDLPNYLALIQSLHFSVKEKNLDAIKSIISTNEKLLKARDENGACPIHVAAQLGQIEVIEFLINNYPSVLNTKDGLGRTALHIAGQGGNQVIYKMLKDAGADPKILDQKGRTAEFYFQNSKGESHNYKLNGTFEASKRFAEEKQINQPVIKKTRQKAYDKRAIEQPGNLRKSSNAKHEKSVKQEKATKNIDDSSNQKLLLIENSENQVLAVDVPDDKSKVNETICNDSESESGGQRNETAESSHHVENEDETVSEHIEAQDTGVDSSTAPENETKSTDEEDEIKTEEQTTNETHDESNIESQIDQDSNSDKNESTDFNKPGSSEQSFAKNYNDGSEMQENNEGNDSEINENIITTNDAEESNQDDNLNEESEIKTENDIEEEEENDAEGEEEENDAEDSAKEENDEPGATTESSIAHAEDNSEEQATTDSLEENIDEKGRTVAEVGSGHSASRNHSPSNNEEPNETNTNEDASLETEEEEKKENDSPKIPEATEQQSDSDTKENESEETEGQELNENKEATNEENVDDTDKENDKTAETTNENNLDPSKDVTDSVQETEDDDDKKNETEEETEVSEVKEEEKEDIETSEVKKDEADMSDIKEEEETETPEEKEEETAQNNEENGEIKGSNVDEQNEKESDVDADVTEKGSDEKVTENEGENTETKEEKENSEETADKDNKDINDDDKKDETDESEKNNQDTDAEKKTDDEPSDEKQDEEKPNLETDQSTTETPKPDSKENETKDEDGEENKDKIDENKPETANDKENSDAEPSGEKSTNEFEKDYEKNNENFEEQSHQTKDHLDELIEHWIKEGDLLRLEHVVLAGQGDRLIERTSDDKQVQDFLDLVPIYMAKIRAVHEAVVKGQLRDVRSILTRKRFALSRDHVGASPLHLAVLHAHTDVATYIISHFPETMDGPDNEGRTPLHYASALPDHGSLYKILKVAGADENIEDKSGRSPKYYLNHRGELTLSELLEPYVTSE